MKTFIVKVYKNKKWITLGLSILYLLLFCFPLISHSKSDNISYNLPFILSLPKNWTYMSNLINGANLNDLQDKTSVIAFVSINITCSLLMLIYFVLAIICLVRLFKGRKFYFTPSLTLAFFTILIYGISISYHSSQGVEEIKYHLNFYPTTYIFLILLILDIVYLVLEWYYLHSGQEKLSTLIAERKAVKQDAQLKQSPEYRIEQLEKELQELKAKNDDKDGQ